MHTPEHSYDTMSRLAAMGVQRAIDGFGTVGVETREQLSALAADAVESLLRGRTASAS